MFGFGNLPMKKFGPFIARLETAPAAAPAAPFAASMIPPPIMPIGPPPWNREAALKFKLLRRSTPTFFTAFRFSTYSPRSRSAGTESPVGLPPVMYEPRWKVLKAFCAGVFGPPPPPTEPISSMSGTPGMALIALMIAFTTSMTALAPPSKMPSTLSHADLKMLVMALVIRRIPTLIGA